MEKINNNIGSSNAKGKSGASKNSKIKWREIEQLKDRFQLEKDLKGYDDSLEHLLEEF